MNLEQHGRNQKTKKKSPRTHLSQVWSPAFRLPWVRSRLKPELRTSPQRRGGRLWERRYPVHHEDTKTRRIAKDFFASSCLRGEIFWLRRAALSSAVFICGFRSCFWLPLTQGCDFVVDDRGDFEAHSPVALRKRQVAARAQGPHAGDLLARRNFKLHLLGADRVESPHEAASHIWIVVIQNVQGIARRCFPGEELGHSFPCNRDGLTRIVQQPAHGILDEQAQIRIPRTPERPIDVSREIRHPGFSALPEYRGRLFRARRSRENHLGWKCGIVGDHR